MSMNVEDFENNQNFVEREDADQADLGDLGQDYVDVGFHGQDVLYDLDQDDDILNHRGDYGWEIPRHLNLNIFTLIKGCISTRNIRSDLLLRKNFYRRLLKTLTTESRQILVFSMIVIMRSMTSIFSNSFMISTRIS